MRFSPLALFLFASVAVGQPSSNWSFTGSADQGAIKQYIDVSTVKRDGKYVRAWTMYSFKEPQLLGPKKFFRSKLHMAYYDCAQDEQAYKTFLFYSGEDGNGEMLDRATVPLSFEAQAPGTLAANLMKSVCALKFAPG